MVKSKITTVVLFIVVMFGSVHQVFANPGVDLAQLQLANGRLELLPYTEILVDDSHKLTLSDVISADKTHFKHSSAIGNSFGFSKANYWLHFSLKNGGLIQDQILLGLAHASIDNAILYSSQADGSYTQAITGESQLHSSRDIDLRNFVFRLTEQKDHLKHYYLLIQTEGSLQLPLTLWTASEFIGTVVRESLLFGAYFGLMLVLVVTAAVSYQMTKDKLFLYYGCYLFATSLMHASLVGFSFQYFWPNLPEWSSRFTAVSVGLTVICALAFSAAFLQLWIQKYRYLKTLYLLLIITAIAAVLMVLFDNYEKGVLLVASLGLVAPFVILLVALRSLFSGYQPARYFVVAWMFMLAGGMAEVLLVFGFIPHSDYTVYALQVGSVFEVTLLGYALMKRIELLRLDKEQAQLDSQQYLFQLNNKLEALVERRTESLRATNLALTELASHDGLTGLLNHNAVLDYLQRMKHLALRHQNNLAVIMLDIDYFKKINDQFGHQVGDRVLVSIASILKKNLRNSDGAGRYGGEEFILILPETNLDSAKILADRIRIQIMAMKLTKLAGRQVTASFGISILNHDNPEEDLVSQADSALYKAKDNGRNQVIVFDQDS